LNCAHGDSKRPLPDDINYQSGEYPQVAFLIERKGCTAGEMDGWMDGYETGETPQK